MTTILLMTLSLVLLALAVRSDREASRIRGLQLNGEPQSGWRILVPTQFINRRVGLLNATVLPAANGLLLKGRNVHMKGMLIALDLVAMDAQGRILQIKSCVAPDSHVPPFPKSTTHILEIAAGQSAALTLKLGDHLSFGDPN